MSNIEEFIATGRRKTAVARVRISRGSGVITINGRQFTNYCPTDQLQTQVVKPLRVVELESSIDVRANVCGGGLGGQAGALSLGISRALEKLDPQLRPLLKRQGLLTRDGRAKERKKPGRPGARKRFQFSKR